MLFQGAALLQFYKWWHHHKHRRPSKVADHTITHIVIWALFLGVLWETFNTELLAISPSAELNLLIVMVLAGMATRGTIMLHNIPAALFAFLALCVVPP